jgi:putative membrane protein
MSRDVKTDHRAPQAFKLEPEATTKKAKPAKVIFEAEPPPQELATVPNPAEMPLSTSPRWGFIFASALATLFALWLGLTATQIVEGFFARSAIMGWLALAVAGLAGIAALAMIFNEIWGLFRLRRIEQLQLSASHAINQDDAASADAAVSGLKKLYANRPDAAWSLKNLELHSGDIIDPRDRVRLAERYLVDPLDEAAHRIIAKRSRRVTLLTTVTPAAALDILFVAAQNLRMLRELASLYGGRPSALATFRLARLVVSHLAVAGGLALSDNFLQHFVGKGLLGRLSARFGEGAVNGILTARIGLAAREVCRPIPQEATKRETLASLAKELANFSDPSKPEN